MEPGEVREGRCLSMVMTIAEELTLLQDLNVSIQRLTPTEIEFDLVGVDASIANALRRVMIAEVSRDRQLGWRLD